MDPSQLGGAPGGGMGPIGPAPGPSAPAGLPGGMPFPMPKRRKGVRHHIRKLRKMGRRRR